jgi:hypothetical protein
VPGEEDTIGTSARSARLGAVDAGVVATLAVGAVYLGLLCHFVAFGRVNHDEGWYLYASRLVYAGQLPYRDFAFFQGPLLPYVYGLPQVLFGPDLEVGRWTSAALSLVTVCFGGLLCRERGGRGAVLFFLATIALTPMVLWSFTTTRSEPLTTPLLMTSAYLLARRDFGARSAMLAGALAALAVVARISMLPAGLAITALAAARSRSHGESTLAAILAFVVVGAIGAGLAFSGDFGSAWFSLYTAQAERDSQLAAAPELGALERIPLIARHLQRLPASFGFVPAAVVVVAALAPGSRRWIGLLCAIAALAYLPHLAPRIVFPEYFVPAFPLLAVACAIALAAFRDDRRLRVRRGATFCALALLAYQALHFTAQVEHRAPAGRSDLAVLREAASYVRAVVPADRTLVTMDTYLAVESGRAVAPGWEMNAFSYFPRLDDETARRFHVVGANALEHATARPDVGAVAFTDSDLAMWIDKVRGPPRSRTAQSEESLHGLLPSLRGFELARVFADFGQFRENLYVLLPAPGRGARPPR